MPSIEFSFAVLIVTISIIILGYFSIRVRSVLNEERRASEIIQDMLSEIGRRTKQQDMRILDQQIRLDIIDVKRVNRNVIRPEPKSSGSVLDSTNVPVTGVVDRDKSRDITGTELEILRLLVNGAKSPIEIQQTVGLSREHVSRIMREIYEKGFVSRKTSERPYHYTLTPSGEKLLTMSS